TTWTRRRSDTPPLHGWSRAARPAEGYRGSSWLLTPLGVDDLLHGRILLGLTILDGFGDERDEVGAPVRDGPFARVGSGEVFGFAAWPFGDPGGPVAVDAGAGGAHPGAEAFAACGELGVPDDAHVAFGLLVVAGEPVLPESGQLPQQFTVPVPHRWDLLGGEPVFVAEPVDPFVEVEEFLLEIFRGEFAPVDRARDRAELGAEVFGVLGLHHALDLLQH